MDKPNRIWYIMARCLSGEASNAEREELMVYMREDAAVQQQYEIMSRLWQDDMNHKEATDEVSEEERKNVSRILQMAQVQQAMDNEEEGEVSGRTLVRRPSRIKRIIYISSGVAATILGIWLFNKKPAIVPQPETTQVVAQKGTRTRTILPDGSVVWLNAGSKISYQPDFDGPLREVKLEGEAYFDVKKDKTKPFIVHANGINIKVLGTAFNVKSYPSDKTVETTLIHGLVQLSHEGSKDEKPIYLHPNEKIIVNKPLPAADESNNAAQRADGAFELVRLDTSSGKDYVETAWVNNRLAFRGESFDALAQKLERWYNINIIFEDEAVKKLNFNGSFENETVAQAFKALAVATPFTFKIKGHEIYVGSTR